MRYGGLGIRIHGRDEKCMQNLRRRDYLGGLGIDDRIVDLKEVEYKLVEWIHRAEDGVQW